MNNTRNYSKLDQLCIHFDQALKAIFNVADATSVTRPSPAAHCAEPPLTQEQKKHSAALMRVNHSGEVCAQALYHGQGLVSKREDVREKMEQAAREEGDHLTWCSERITELGSHTSYLNPAWYVGSFIIGVTAGWMGDEWSLGFLAETENQVVKHLENQLARLPQEDIKSAKILHQMQKDEAQHQDDAMKAGATELPWFIKKLMQFSSKIMVKTAYWV